MIDSIIGGKWRITEEIGDGGHAYVYKGVCGDEVAAVKWLKPSSAMDDDLESRFKVEAAALEMLGGHPAIVGFKGYVFDPQTRHHFLILEYMDRGSLEDLIEKEPLDQRYAVPIFYKILDGVRYAHEHGYIHRDIKPNNILLSKTGDVKLTDFGITKVVGGQKLTREGFVVGTPEYMAPEYLSMGQVTNQSDLYSLGVTFYQVLTCHKPFEQKSTSESPIDFVRRVCKDEPRKPSDYLPVPPPLERFLLKAIARETKKRYRDVKQMMADLEKAYPQLIHKPIEIPEKTQVKTALLAIQPQVARSKTPGHAVAAPGDPGEAKASGMVLAVILAVVGAAAGWFGATTALSLEVGPAAGVAVVLGALFFGLGALLGRSRKPKIAAAPQRAPHQAPTVPEEVDDDSEIPYLSGDRPPRKFDESETSDLSAYLLVTTGESEGKRYGLRPISRIGRDLRFDIRPKDGEVSRHHAAVSFMRDHFVVEDLGSTNGTYVNERRVEGKVPIKPGDIVRIGQTSMRFDWDPNARL